MLKKGEFLASERFLSEIRGGVGTNARIEYEGNMGCFWWDEGKSGFLKLIMFLHEVKNVSTCSPISTYL